MFYCLLKSNIKGAKINYKPSKELKSRIKRITYKRMRKDLKNWLPKKQTKLESNLFYSKNESWWLIGFSMLLASGIMIEPQLICSSLLKGQLSDMWLYWSAGIGSAFSVSFFANLWRKVPIKTENEFLYQLEL